MALAAENKITIPYTPNKKQAKFHSCPHNEILYGGSKGGGKSCALVMEALAYALEYPGAQVYLFRETFDDLEANLIREWKEKVPKLLYKYNESKHQADLFNGTVVKFRFVRNKEDSERYQGRSFDFIGIDEIVKWEELWVQNLLSCLRSPKGFPPRFRCTANPGGIGHVWVKKRFINGTDYGKSVATDPITGNTIAFIPAQVYDNDVLMKNDPAYVKRLENLPPEKKKAYLYGDWDVYEGQAFEEFDPVPGGIHVCKSFPIPAHWRRWVSVDNGYTDPFAWYSMAVDEEGTVYIYREFTRDYDDPKLTYSEQAQRFMEMATYTDINEGVVMPEKIDVFIVGHDAFNSHPLSESGKTIVDYYAEGGVHGCIRAVTDRKLRKATWHEYFKPYTDENTGKLTAKVKIFDCCKKLIETMPLQQEDEKDSEKVAETNIDHWYDAAGYGLIFFHTSRSKRPKEQEPLIRRHKNKLARHYKYVKRAIS